MEALSALEVRFGPTRRGMIYELGLRMREQLRDVLGLCSRRQLVVTYDDGENLDDFHERAMGWVLPLLLGIRPGERIEGIERVRLVESYPRRLVFEKPMSDIVSHVCKT